MTRDDQMVELMNEAHRLLARHAVERTAYYAAPFTDYELLDIQQASMKAIDCILHARALASRHNSSPVRELRKIMRDESDRRVVELLEDVLARVDPILTNADAAA